MTQPGGLFSVFATAEESPGFGMWRVCTLWQRAVRGALAPLALTHAQFVMLASAAYLGHGDAPVRQVDIATHAGTDLTMTSQVLRALEVRGLVHRVPHPTDSRAKSIQVTLAGRDKARGAIRAVEAADHAFFACLGDDVKGLVGLMTRLGRGVTPSAG